MLRYFFVIATKKVTNRHPERERRISSWSSLRFMRYFADAQYDGQTIFVYRWSLFVYRKSTKNEPRKTKNEPARAFCLASATHFGGVILSVSEGSPYVESFD